MKGNQRTEKFQEKKQNNQKGRKGGTQRKLEHSNPIILLYKQNKS
jgi:hypothetical protein